jgi:hypothetical protein
VAEPLLGYVAAFGNADALVDAASAARNAGFRRLVAFTPFPIEGLAQILRFHDRRIGWLAIIGGLVGFFGMLAVQLFVNWDYPIEVGGRPIYAFPAFFVVDFEIMVLFSVLFTVIGMLAINGLPKLHHPLFGTPRFGCASDDRFFLYIDARDPKFDVEKTRTFLGSLGAWVVEPVSP